MEFSRIEKLIFITDNVDNLRKEYRVELLQIILGTQTTADKVQEKGSGTQIKTKDIQNDLVNALFNFVKTKIEKMQENIDILISL
jgi:hypothetical protein